MTPVHPKTISQVIWLHDTETGQYIAENINTKTENREKNSHQEFQEKEEESAHGRGRERN